MGEHRRSHAGDPNTTPPREQSRGPRFFAKAEHRCGRFRIQEIAMSLSKSCKFLAATDGRDKLYKFFHYGARFLSWFCLNTANNAQWAKYWSNIDSVMSDGRKLLRMFKFLSEIEKLGTIREARPMLLVANLLKTLGMAGYFFFNNLSWAMKFNIISGDEKKWGKLSFWAWTVGLLFALVLDVVKYRDNSRRQQKPDRAGAAEEGAAGTGVRDDQGGGQPADLDVTGGNQPHQERGCGGTRGCG